VLAGARQDTLAPVPVKAPVVAVQVYCSRSTAVSSSLTAAVIGTISSTSAKPGGSLRRVPCTTIDSIVGGLFTGGGGGGGGGGGSGRVGDPHATIPSISRNTKDQRDVRDHCEGDRETVIEQVADGMSDPARKCARYQRSRPKNPFIVGASVPKKLLSQSNHRCCS